MSEQENETVTVPDKQAGIAFEKYKYRVELIKWFISSVALVLITMIVECGFRDRETGMKELVQYDKYVSELIVLNKDPGQKRMLAQFFSNVTPSKALKKGWEKYYCEVDKEYQASIAVILAQDSVVKAESIKLIKDGLKTKADTLKKLENDSILAENERKKNPAVIMPSKSGVRDYQLAISSEAKGFAFLLSKEVDNAILAFEMSENAYHSFHQVFEIASFLKTNRVLLVDKESPEWKKVYNTIATKYTWQMPQAVKTSLLEQAKQ